MNSRHSSACAERAAIHRRKARPPSVYFSAGSPASFDAILGQGSDC